MAIVAEEQTVSGGQCSLMKDFPRPWMLVSPVGKHVFLAPVNLYCHMCSTLACHTIFIRLLSLSKKHQCSTTRAGQSHFLVFSCHRSFADFSSSLLLWLSRCDMRATCQHAKRAASAYDRASAICLKITIIWSQTRELTWELEKWITMNHRARSNLLRDYRAFWGVFSNASRILIDVNK
jgi:hypothetical protein